MTWMLRGLKLLSGLVLAGLLIVAAGAAIYRHLALPVTEGSLRVDGLRAAVEIERDAHGIPTIRAGSDDDAWFGLGFVHAQDRLWQLETHRRIAAGRLAEAFGAGAVDTDRFVRALGVHRRAEQQWQQASPAVRQMLTAYSAGINAYLGRHLRARPPEFLILGLRPEPWSPVDSIAWTTMMAWDLGGNWNTELLRMRLAQHMPVERIQQLLPPYPGEKPLPTADYRTVYGQLGIEASSAPATAGAWPAVADSGVEGAGSNNWVVAGSRSVTGKPLLANDPHLKLTAPALWYFARIEAPGLKVAGATMPGLPTVVLGQNEQVAWGWTNTGPDVQDLYLERVDRGDPRRYETPGGWASFESFDEVIEVRGGAPLRFTARRTRHGPVISDVPGITDGLTGAQDANGIAPYVLALRWTALDTDAASTLDAGLGFNRARSVDEFIAASADYVAPMQSMVVADAQRIAMVAAGRVPLRKPEHDLRGLAPAPGWDPKYDWDGYVPANATPRDRDPARGWIATANQRIHGPQYPHFITSEWAPPYRQQRIERLLAQRPLHTLDSLAAIQADVLSTATQRLLPWLRRARSDHPLAEPARRELEGFEGTMAAERAAPLIFWAWVRQLTRGVFADDIGTALFERQLATRSFREALELVLERDDTGWCNDGTTPEVETCARQSDAALTRALTDLQARWGSDVSAWRWGDAHAARAEHRPFSRVPKLAPWFELRTPVGGDTFTVNVARVALRPDPHTGELFLDEHGPSLRALYDLADRRRSRFMHSSGQSGLAFSGDYGGFVAPWARVEYLPVWGDGRAGDALRLEPADGAGGR
ncbi:MAG TPA: penicillin acylase family protein [Methylibium sp.]|nr:penicillin acylase family protein [Methylibium sp.]